MNLTLTNLVRISDELDGVLLPYTFELPINLDIAGLMDVIDPIQRLRGVINQKSDNPSLDNVSLINESPSSLAFLLAE
ncbi:MAG: hypothetical protein ACPL3P_07390 [Anaerolineales bacterium]